MASRQDVIETDFIDVEVDEFLGKTESYSAENAFHGVRDLNRNSVLLAYNNKPTLHTN